MEGLDYHSTSGSLRISTEVIEKIARHAALEVDGVRSVQPPASGAGSLLDKITQPKAVQVELKNGVADIEVSLVVNYGAKIPDLSEQVQKNVKDAVQNMTNITVGRVDVLVAGLAAEKAE